MNAIKVEDASEAEGRTTCPCGAPGECLVPSGDVSVMLCWSCTAACTTADGEVLDPAKAIVMGRDIAPGDRDPETVGPREN